MAGDEMTEENRSNEYFPMPYSQQYANDQGVFVRVTGQQAQITELKKRIVEIEMRLEKLAPSRAHDVTYHMMGSEGARVEILPEEASEMLEEEIARLIAKNMDVPSTLYGRLATASDPPSQIEVTEEMLRNGSVEMAGHDEHFGTTEETLREVLRVMFGAENVSFPKSDK